MGEKLAFKPPAPSEAGAILLGQPFTIANCMMPVNCQFTCNCVPGNAPMTIMASAPVTCARCAKTYAVAFNPSNGQIMVAMGETAPQGDPS